MGKRKICAPTKSAHEELLSSWTVFFDLSDFQSTFDYVCSLLQQISPSPSQRPRKTLAFSLFSLWEKKKKEKKQKVQKTLQTDQTDQKQQVKQYNSWGVVVSLSLDSAKNIMYPGSFSFGQSEKHLYGSLFVDFSLASFQAFCCLKTSQSPEVVNNLPEAILASPIICNWHFCQCSLCNCNLDKKTEKTEKTENKETKETTSAFHDLKIQNRMALQSFSQRAARVRLFLIYLTLFRIPIAGSNRPLLFMRKDRRCREECLDTILFFLAFLELNLIEFKPTFNITQIYNKDVQVSTFFDCDRNSVFQPTPFFLEILFTPAVSPLLKEFTSLVSTSRAIEITSLSFQDKDNLVNLNSPFRGLNSWNLLILNGEYTVPAVKEKWENQKKKELDSFLQCLPRGFLNKEMMQLIFQLWHALLSLFTADSIERFWKDRSPYFFQQLKKIEKNETKNPQKIWRIIQECHENLVVWTNDIVLILTEYFIFEKLNDSKEDQDGDKNEDLAQFIKVFCFHRVFPELHDLVERVKEKEEKFKKIHNESKKESERFGCAVNRLFRSGMKRMETVAVLLLFSASCSEFFSNPQSSNSHLHLLKRWKELQVFFLPTSFAVSKTHQEQETQSSKNMDNRLVVPLFPLFDREEAEHKAEKKKVHSIFAPQGNFSAKTLFSSFLQLVESGSKSKLVSRFFVCNFDEEKTKTKTATLALYEEKQKTKILEEKLLEIEKKFEVLQLNNKQLQEKNTALERKLAASQEKQKNERTEQNKKDQKITELTEANVRHLQKLNESTEEIQKITNQLQESEKNLEITKTENRRLIMQKSAPPPTPLSLLKKLAEIPWSQADNSILYLTQASNQVTNLLLAPWYTFSSCLCLSQVGGGAEPASTIPSHLKGGGGLCFHPSFDMEKDMENVNSQIPTNEDLATFRLYQVLQLFKKTENDIFKNWEKQFQEEIKQLEEPKLEAFILANQRRIYQEHKKLNKQQNKEDFVATEQKKLETEITKYATEDLKLGGLESKKHILKSILEKILVRKFFCSGFTRLMPHEVENVCHVSTNDSTSSSSASSIAFIEASFFLAFRDSYLEESKEVWQNLETIFTSLFHDGATVGWKSFFDQLAKAKKRLQEKKRIDYARKKFFQKWTWACENAYWSIKNVNEKIEHLNKTYEETKIYAWPIKEKNKLSAKEDEKTNQKKFGLNAVCLRAKSALPWFFDCIFFLSATYPGLFLEKFDFMKMMRYSWMASYIEFIGALDEKKEEFYTIWFIMEYNIVEQSSQLRNFEKKTAKELFDLNESNITSSNLKKQLLKALLEPDLEKKKKLREKFIAGWGKSYTPRMLDSNEEIIGT